MKIRTTATIIATRLLKLLSNITSTLVTPIHIIPVIETKNENIQPSPAHQPLYPFMKYSATNTFPNQSLSNLNQGTPWIIVYTIPPVQITKVIIAIMNQTWGCSRTILIYLRVETKITTMIRKSMFFYKITKNGSISLTSVLSLLFKYSIIVYASLI